MQLTVNRGKIHDYLGMIFNFETEGEVQITMYQYIDSLINDAPNIYGIPSRDHGVGIANPAPSNIYEVRDPDAHGNTLLSEEEHEDYHTLTAKNLYL